MAMALKRQVCLWCATHCHCLAASCELLMESDKNWTKIKKLRISTTADMRSFFVLVHVLSDSVNNSRKLTWLHITAVAAMWRSVSPSDKPVILPCMPRICGGRCAEKSVRDRMTLPCPVNSLAAFLPVPLCGLFTKISRKTCRL